MNAIVLDNNILRLRLDPDFGGRVSELTDLRTGRNWLVGGPSVGSPAQEATFGVEQARGWDECFPSAAPCLVEAWPMPLRDHGEFWGRPVAVVAAPDSVTLTAQAGPVRFQRVLALDGDRLTLTYRVFNEDTAAMPYLWGQHLLIAPEEGDRLELPGLDSLDAAFLSHGGCVLTTDPVAFPDPKRDDLPLLDRIHPLTANFAAKLFAPVPAEAAARVVGRSGSFNVSWNGEKVGYLGLWLDYGGWPAESPVSQISLAPSTAPMESLADAVASGKANCVQPGAAHEWTVIIRIAAEKDSLHD
ncbi:hypothetical protein [Ensifer canadensis]